MLIPARNEAARIGSVVRGALEQAARASRVEVIVIDDASTDATRDEAEHAGARVIDSPARGNPAAARNAGARAATGDPLVFLDADCVPAPGWLDAILAAHDAGASVVGGSLALPPGLSFTARCDYYCGWYLVHPARPGGVVPHHPPPNLAVRRGPFLDSAGFTERAPLGYTNEERAWQAALRGAGHEIVFEPRAVAWHHNRPGLGNLLRRSYRWGYTALESKGTSRSARQAWIYRFPRLMILFAPALAVAQTVYILGCWLRAGRLEPLLMAPLVLASRVAWVSGMTVGGIRWLRRGRRGEAGERPQPRWQ